MLVNVIIPTRAAIDSYRGLYARLPSYGIPFSLIANIACLAARESYDSAELDIDTFGETLADYATGFEMNPMRFGPEELEEVIVAGYELYKEVLEGIRAARLMENVTYRQNDPKTFLSNLSYSRLCGKDIVLVAELSTFGWTYGQYNAQKAHSGHEGVSESVS